MELLKNFDNENEIWNFYKISIRDIFTYLFIEKSDLYCIVSIFVAQIRLSIELLKIEMFIKFLYKIFLLTCLLRKVICIVSIFVAQIRLSMELLKIEIFIKFLYEIFYIYIYIFYIFFYLLVYWKKWSVL